MMDSAKVKIQSEKLAYWYFRLNGCFTIENFVVHPDSGHQQRTDIDLITVRFPYRAELLATPMRDDEKHFSDVTKIQIFLVEVKKGKCNLNKTWIKPKNRNMERMLRAIGAFPKDEINNIADKLYDYGCYIDNTFQIKLCCIGSVCNPGLKKDVIQLAWKQVLQFIHSRFNEYRLQKSSHPQWDSTGRKLWQIARQYNKFDDYFNAIEIIDKKKQ